MITRPGTCPGRVETRTSFLHNVTAADPVYPLMEDPTNNPQQERLAALYEVSSRLGTTLDLSELLNLVMDAIIQLTGAERGYLVLQNGVTGELETGAARNVDQQTIEGRSMEISRSVVQRAIDSGQPILTDNAQADNRFSAYQSVIGFRLRSIMCTPLRARGRVIGAVYVDNRLLSAAFKPEDLALLEAFANQAAMAIENARLFQQTDQALARRVEELTVLQRIDQELNRSLDLNQVLSLALDWAIRLTNADGGSIGLMQADEETGEAYLQLLVSWGEAGAQEGQRIPAGHPILAQVLASGVGVHTTQVTPEQAIDATAAVAQLAVPIKREGEIIGLICLESYRRSVNFTAEDMVFVSRLADRSAVAIENSRLYEAVQAANEAKNAFISIVTHELRIPMTSIRGYTDLLLGQMMGPLNEAQTGFLQTVRRNLDRMNVLIRDLSDINRIETGRMKFDLAYFPLEAVVQHVVGDLQEAIETRQQQLVVDIPAGLLPVYGDRTRVGQVLTNLISNANKYTPEQGQLTVRVQAHGPDALAVAVQDNGIGISEEDQARLFTQFFRSDADAVRQQVGWGLGLSIVKKLVEAQGGEIWCESAPGQGSTFVFTLPVAAPAGDVNPQS